MIQQLAMFPQGNTDRQDVCRRRHGGNPESVAAHRHVHKEERYVQILDLLEHAGARGRTLDELSVLLKVDSNQISGRVTELRLAGKIRRLEEKRQTRTTAWASVYVLAGGEGPDAVPLAHGLEAVWTNMKSKQQMTRPCDA